MKISYLNQFLIISCMAFISKYFAHFRIFRLLHYLHINYTLLWHSCPVTSPSKHHKQSPETFVPLVWKEIRISVQHNNLYSGFLSGGTFRLLPTLYPVWYRLCVAYWSSSLVGRVLKVKNMTANLWYFKLNLIIDSLDKIRFNQCDLKFVE